MCKYRDCGALPAPTSEVLFPQVTAAKGFFPDAARSRPIRARCEPRLGLVRWPADSATARLLCRALRNSLLTRIVHQYPFVNAWLTTKLLLLVAYIGLGTMALKRARTIAGRSIAFAAALATFAYIICVAITHHPAGWLLLCRASWRQRGSCLCARRP